MARLVSLSTLETRVLQRANLEHGANNSIIQSGELDDCINEGVAEWYECFVQADGPYYLNSVTFQTTSNADTYAIGSGLTVNVSDFYKGKGVDIVFGQNIVVTGRSFMWSERNRYRWLPYSGWIYSQPVFYTFTGKTSAVANAAQDSIKFIPIPNGSFSITLWYYPVPPKLVSSTDSIDGMNGSEEIVVLSAAIKLLTKQEQFEHAALLEQQKAVQVQRLLEAIITRDAESPPRVQDVSLSDGWLPGRGGGY